MSGASAGPRRATAAYLALTLAVLAVAGWCLLSRALAPGDGSAVDSGSAAVVPAANAVTVIDATPESGLRAGDRIIAIDGVPIADRAGSLLGGQPALAGDTLVYQIARDGRPITVDVPIRQYPLFRDLLDGWPTALVVAMLAVVACVVFLVRPAEPAARAAVVCAGLAVLTSVGATLFPLQAVDIVVGDQFWRWFVGEAAFAMLWAGMLHFALAFPSVGVRHYRAWVAAGYLGVPLLYGAGGALAVLTVDSAIGRLAFVGSPALPALAVYPVLIVAVLVGQHIGARDTAARRRLRWLAVTLGAAALVHLAVWAGPTLVTGAPLLPERFQALVLLPVPIAVGMAVLRHRALDVEVVLSRSLVYGALSAGVIAVYVAVVAGLSLLFPPMERMWQQAVAAAAVAITVQPLRAWLQGLVNKKLFGYTDDPYRVVSGLASRLENTHTPGELLPGITETVASALRLPFVAIEIPGDVGPEVVARTGQPSGDRHELPLTFQGERVGTLVVGGRAVLRARDRHALAEVARHAGAAVHTARLTRDLRRSRDRIVLAREQERRRILHELHDGVGPTLAAIALGLDAGRRAVPADSTIRVLLDRLRDELQDAIAELRRLAAGLRPPVLDQIGLVPAIREYAGALASRTARATSGVTIMLETPSVMPALPSAVDVAAYRIVCEALTNVTRHSYARSCAVRLWVDSDLHIEVVDDGVGLPRHPAGGVGLASMRERAEELGGGCLVAADADGGTRVEATLPLPREGSEP